MTDPIQQRPADADVIAERLKEHLESGYFAGVIKGIYTLINHAAFLERRVASLKATIARTQAEASRPVTIPAGGLDIPIGAVVVDKDGDAWQRLHNTKWRAIDGREAPGPQLDRAWGPYSIVYTPKEES